MSIVAGTTRRQLFPLLDNAIEEAVHAKQHIRQGDVEDLLQCVANAIDQLKQVTWRMNQMTEQQKRQFQAQARQCL